MVERRTEAIRRRTVLGTVGALGAGILAGCGQTDPDGDSRADDSDASTTETSTDDGAPYEIWALDQGTDVGYVYRPDGEGFEAVDSIDFGAALDGGHDHGHDNLAPHMIDFSSDFAYAAVAIHHGDGVAIVRTEDREVVASVPTGHHSHFAAFSPDDEYITVDVVGDNAIKKVDANLETETFEIVDEIVLTEEAGAAFEGRDPTCHYYTGTGYTYHTLGPSYHDAGLAVIDHEAFELVESYTDDEVAANCGVFPHPTEPKVYLTAGLPSDPEADVEGVGEYFVMDAERHEILKNESTRGVDAHGLWITPDGEELWITNRETNDGVIVDTSTDEIIEEVDAFGPETGASPADSDAPDILAAAPDGEYVFATARGPNPMTADPQASTGVSPGFFVLDAASRELLEVVQPDPDNPDSDFHGIGVRPLKEFDGLVSPL